MPRIQGVISLLLLFVIGAYAASCNYGYFDPHNHVNGILPWQAYADLPTFLAQGLDPVNVGRTAKENLWNWINNYYIANNITPHVYDPVTRLGFGTISTSKIFSQPASSLTTKQLDGVLQRVLTATPFTEFDTAYKLRGELSDPSKATSYWMSNLYTNTSNLFSDLCDATVGELTNQKIGISEQSLSFSSWSTEKLNWLRCFTRKKNCTVDHRILLQTLTNYFASIKLNETHAAQYVSIEGTGKCANVNFASPVNLTAVLEAYKKGLTVNPIPTEITDQQFYDTVQGIDTAGPELACFSKYGMEFFKKLSKVVLDASKTRNNAGYKGRLLVHLHVGEGGAIYYKENVPTTIAFSPIFGSLPGSKPKNIISNPTAAKNNIKAVLKAIEEFAEANPNWDKYIIFRLGHVTQIDLSLAKKMEKLGVEADINMESNLITGALDVAHLKLNQLARVKKDLANEIDNFNLDDLTHYLVPDATNIKTVSKVYGRVGLRYLLEAKARVMILGTDGGGVEHSDIVRSYKIVNTLIDYWNTKYPSFKKAGIDFSVFKTNEKTHIQLMAGQKEKGRL